VAGFIFLKNNTHLSICDFFIFFIFQQKTKTNADVESGPREENDPSKHVSTCMKFRKRWGNSYNKKVTQDSEDSSANGKIANRSEQQESSNFRMM
jgi:hypothetical protein